MAPPVNFARISSAIPIPAAIHNIFVPQTIPEALREYEEAGTLEKLYENGILSGYRVETHGENGELDSVQIFDTAGNSIRNELYNSDGTLLGYVLYEYDVTGYCKRVDQYDNTGMIYSAYEIDSDGNEVKREIYTDGRLTQTWITEYDDAGNMVQSEVYIGGTLRYVNEYDQAGNLIRIESYDDNGDLFGYGLYEYDSDGNQIKEESYDPDGTLEGYTLYEYDSNGNWLKSENYDPDGTLNRYTLFEWDVNGTKTRQETYSADDELLNYWELNDVGEWVDYNADGTPVE